MAGALDLRRSMMGSGGTGRMCGHEHPQDSDLATGPPWQREAAVIWLILAWCGVAVWLGLAIGRLLKDNRRDNAAADKCRMKLLRAQQQARQPRGQVRIHGTDRVTDVHRLLAELDDFDPRLAKTATLSWIGGLSRPAIAATLGTTVDVVERDLYRARCMLWNRSVRSHSGA